MDKNSVPVPARVWREPGHLLALGLGSGLSPWAPGTVATAVAVPMVWALMQCSLWGQAGVLVIGFAIGVWLCGRTAQALGVHDHSAIVWDEWVGYGVTMWAVPQGWWWLAAGFVLFRLFDITKPWPIRWADRRVAGGFGIMFDDLLAGLYAWGLLQLAAWYLG